MRCEKQTGHNVCSVHTNKRGEFSHARSTLEADELRVSMTSFYTPQSGGLAKRCHRIILLLASTCRQQAKLSMRYLEFAIKHVVDCKNFVSNSITNQVPFETIFGRAPSDIKHLKAFGCRMLSRLVAKMIDTFAPRCIEGVRLFHKGGGVYRLLFDSGTVCTKHVWAFIKRFLRQKQIGDG